MRVPGLNERFSDRYTILEELGRGAFGEVLRARDERNSRDVAIKFLVPGPDGYAHNARARFEREAKVVGNLGHPNIVKLFDFGSTEDGLLYMVFELVPGADLSSLLERQEFLPEVVVRHIAAQVLGALSDAHVNGVLHRDVKPRNIVVHAYGDDPYRAKLLDFGIAKLAEPEATGGGLTVTGAAIGTPAYMAPEQNVGDAAVPQTDIYAVGVLGLKMLAGDAFAQSWKSYALERFLGVDGAPPGAPPQVDRQLLQAFSNMAAGPIAERPATAVAALRLLRPPAEPPAPGRPPDESARTSGLNTRGVAIAASIGVVAAVSVALWPAPPQTRVRRPPTPPAETPKATPEPALAPDVGPDADSGARTFEDTTPQADACGAVTQRKAGEPPFQVASEQGRRFVVYLPASYDPSTRYPVALLFHDQLDTAAQMIANTGFTELADKHRYVLVAPEDRFHATDDAVSDAQWKEEDLEDMPAVLRTAGMHACLDTDNVFALGQGRGGIVASRLACVVDNVRAVATNAYRLRSEPCTRAVPYLHLFGVEDPENRPDGGEGCLAQVGFQAKELVRPVADHDDAWKAVNRCSGERKRYAPAKHPACYTWDCETSYVSCHLPGGRMWARADSWRKLPFIKERCMKPPADFPIGPRIIEFFEQHRSN